MNPEIDDPIDDPIQGRIRATYEPTLNPPPGLADSLFEAIEDSRISVPPPPSRWPAIGVIAGCILVFGLFGLSYILSVDRKTRREEIAVGAGDGETRTEEERKRDQEAYTEAIAGLRRDHPGAWVAIAYGKVSRVGASMADVLPANPDARHRFMFRVGDEGDREEMATEWYGPRFAGPKFAVATGADFAPDFHRGTTLLKDGKTVGPYGVPPFPRVPVGIRAPADGVPWTQVPPLLTVDVFLGTVGPPLMLMAEDWDALGLARFEVPGTMKVMDLPCRMATVDVHLNDLGATGRLVAACPAFPRERLVEFARRRDAFWRWAWQSAADVAKGHEAKVVVFAADRVVGEGPDVNQALLSALGKPDGAYHRYVVGVPRPDPMSYDAAAFTEEKTIRLNGVELTARSDGKTVLLSTKDVADRLRLEMAESGRDVTVVRDGKPRAARAGYAWQGDEPKSSKASDPGVYLVVYETDSGATK